MDPAQATPRPNPQQERVVQLIDRIAPRSGIHPTEVRGVEIIRDPNPFPRKPAVYVPSIIVVAQGRKRCYLGDQVIQYDPHHYLVLSVPLPLECEMECTPEEPLLAVKIGVDRASVGEVLLEMEEAASFAEGMPPSICVSELDQRMGGAVIRLLECLESRRDSKVLGPQIVREIIYLALTGEQGGALRVLAAGNERFDQLARALRLIHADPSRDFSAESLAKTARMSVSSFHHSFKQMTATSPFQYLKRIRLDAALRLMVHEGHTASSAAMNVGYKSATQFSREFKRLFGATPREEAGRVRALLDGEISHS